MDKDTIYRQAAIDATAEYLRDMAKIDNPSLPMSIDGWKPLAGKILDKVPSAQPETMFYPQIDGVTPSVIAQPEQKKGEWLEHYAHEDGERDGVWCSECREHYYFGGQLMNFCPNCGADMRN